MLSVLPLLLPGLGFVLFLGDGVDVFEITRTELPTGTPVAPLADNPTVNVTGAAA